MHVNRHTDLNSCSDRVFIEDLTALGDIRNGLAEAISSWAAGFPEHDRSAGCERVDRTCAFSRGGCCGGLRHLCPGERGRDCQGDTQ